MKKTLLFILLVIASYSISTGQISDANTEIINEYFQVAEIENTDVKSSKTNSDSNLRSYVEVIQIGVNNIINVNFLQIGDEQIVSQTGQQNNYEYYNYYSNQNSSMQVNQEGNLNSVQVFGENSLMKDARINQKSDFKSIVVKNYSK